MKRLASGLIQRVAVATVAAVAAAPSAQAAVLTMIPMQGGMVMPMVSYHAAEGRMHVRMPVEVPQLIPLLVSRPGDSFDPADLWFGALDPSRQGASFSRRYGFAMDVNSDPLPPGAQMWIRKLSGSADLRIYRYSASAPKLFEPIFGTDGVTNALHWNGMMFHPAVAAPPGTNELAATFEVFLLDVVSGQELPGSSSGPFTFNWTNVPDGRPVLRITPGGFVSWPSNTATNWTLECAGAVDESNWTPVTKAPVTADGWSGVVLDGSARQQFFRMRYIP